MTERIEPKRYEHVRDIPTEELANRFVGQLIRAKGNLVRYQLLAAMMIRELRGEPQPFSDGVSEDGKK